MAELTCNPEIISVYQYNPSFAVVEALAGLRGEEVDSDFVLRGLPNRILAETLMLQSPMGVSLSEKIERISEDMRRKGEFLGYEVTEGDNRKVFRGFYEGKAALEDRNGKISFVDMNSVVLSPKSIDNVVVRLTGRKGLEDNLKFLYVTEGLDWDFSYNASVGEDKFDLSGEYVITNNSGTTFKDVMVNLVKGKVFVSRGGRHYEEVGPSEEGAEAMMCELGAIDEVSGMSTDELAITKQHMPNFQRTIQSTSDLVIDSLPRKMTIGDGERLTVPILPFKGVPYRKELVYDPMKFGVFRERSRGGGSIAITLSFENTKENNLGMRLFPGDLRFYVNSGQGGYARTMLDYVYPGETGMIKIGALSSVEVEGGRKGDKEEVRLKNYSNEGKEIIVVEHLGRDMRIKNPLVSLDNKPQTVEARVSEREARIPVNVPAGKEAILTYGVSRLGFFSRLGR